MSDAQDRVVEPGRGGRRAVDDGDLVAVLEDGSEERTHLVGRLGLGAVGGEAAVQRDGGEVGDDVAGHAAGHRPPPGAPRGTRSPGSRAGAPRSRRRGAGASPRRWMALRPIHGRAVWARCPRRVTSIRSVPWHPASSSPPVGSPRMATSPASRSGRSRDEVGEAVVLGRDLLARVEDVGHVDGRFGDGLGQREHHRQPALHVGAAEAPEHVAVDAGVGVAVHRHGVGVAGEEHPRRRSSWVRATRLAPTRSTSRCGRARSRASR